MTPSQLAMETTVLPDRPSPDVERGRTRRILWTPGALRIELVAAPDHPVVMSSIEQVRKDGDDVPSSSGCTQPLVELTLTGDGRARNNTRFTNTGAGARLRYASHEATSADGVHTLDVEQLDASAGLRVVTTFTASDAVAATRVVTTVHHDGTVPVILEAVTSLATGALVYPGESTKDVQLISGTGEQLAENRWTSRPVWSQGGLADFNSAGMDQPGRGAVQAVGTSTWSTARALPTGGLENAVTGRSLVWQIEHNGGWRWEVDNVREGEDSLALLLLGPEDLDHHWAQELVPGASFTTVPVSVAVAATGFTGALAAMTQHRRWLRRARTADRGSLLVFNDYMNTLNGDPTTERLLPLVRAASEAGAEAFCIDAGWYDDTEAGDWFPTVGEWMPSVRRFPGGGLAAVADAIHATGMRFGLWVEPEVVGVLSPVADTLPDEAFLQRFGRRVAEHGRYFLDLRHPAARAHLDSTFDRLIDTYGASFFKLDYNVTPGPGGDRDAFSVGAGLLEHNRAHLRWFAELRRRHPDVVFENCSSGAMRADFAMLEQFDFQSTSDQEDFRLYPWIAAGAPVQMLPEQAGNWAYPNARMSLEETAYTMVTGLCGRLYLAGFLHELSAEQRDLVHDAVAVFCGTRADIAQAAPSWPLGFPQWYDDACALTLTTPHRTLVYVWHRGSEDAELTLRLGPNGATDPQAGSLVELYPRNLAGWGVADAPGGVTLRPGVGGPSARVYEWIATPAAGPHGPEPR